jgi:hypothetical protein
MHQGPQILYIFPYSVSVKAAKIMAASAEKAITLKTPTKSRSNSLNRSLSRSNSQRKNTLHSQL